MYLGKTECNELVRNSISAHRYSIFGSDNCYATRTWVNLQIKASQTALLQPVSETLYIVSQSLFTHTSYGVSYASCRCCCVLLFAFIYLVLVFVLQVNSYAIEDYRKNYLLWVLLTNPNICQIIHKYHVRISLVRKISEKCIKIYSTKAGISTASENRYPEYRYVRCGNVDIYF